MQDDRNFGPEFVQRTLDGFARDYAGVFALFDASLQGRNPDLAALHGSMVEHYRRLFIPPVMPTLGAPAPEGAAVLSRCQAAADRCARIAATIAFDASRRLTAALRDSDPGAPPITTLRELYELWIDCGEAAYAAVAGHEEFAAAQAELLAAMTESRAAASPP